ncbi:CAMK/CAMKL/GIN4 protein kinase [Coprinopsis cinerea AmutBmut pab1-1]|nr:CAMK/CAMKL/GIN4 protein kinase [Coprinopsis cinerea AmutBmut pab1-1]
MAHRPGFGRNISVQVASPTNDLKAGVVSATTGPPSARTKPMQVKRVTLTSKKNWWMVEMDEEDEVQPLNNSINSFSSSEETAVEHEPAVVYKEYNHGIDEQVVHHHHHPSHKVEESPPPSPVYHPSRHPNSIFSFPTPTAYAAPPNATASLTPFAHGSASELFKCVVKKPDVIQLEINGEMQSNASDVTVQFLAELRVYTTVARHRNICAFYGCLENVGIVLEYLECRTLYDVIMARPPLTLAQKIDYHNQLLDGLTHLHSYRLSHGDLSLLNVQVTRDSNTIKLLDFGRSVSADSDFKSPHDEPVDPFPYLHSRQQPKLPAVRIEQIHPGTRPFSAPEILRGECQDPLLADAYSFGMILVCLDRCECVDVKPWDQRKDKLPGDLFENCELFEERAREYLKKWNEGRRALDKKDMIPEEI